MSDIDIPFCIAANSDTIYIASLRTEYNDNSGRPPSLFLYSSQPYPTSLSSIQWKSEAASVINNEMVGDQSLPSDNNGYWCAVDDTGTFVIMSGGKKIENSNNPFKRQVSPHGLLYDKPSKPKNPTMGGLAIPAYDNVPLNGTYPCIDNHSCNGHLYVIPTTPGSPANFGFVTHNSTSGFFFETLERTTKKFTQVGHPNSYLNSVKDWDAFGYYNNLIVAFSISAKEAWSFNLDGKGQPGQSTGHLQLDANAASDCAQIERGYFANVNNRSYFSCSLRSKPGQYAMFSFETTRITKVAEFPIKIDGMLKGIVPVPNRNGDAPTWAIAYSDKLNGLQGVELSSSSRSRIIGGAVGGVAAVIVIILAVFFWRRKRNQKKSNKTQAQDGLQSTENNHLSSVDANGIALQAGNSEVKGDGSLLKIEEPPLPPLPHEALSQSQQPQLYPQPQPQPQPYTQPYPHTSPQQYPQQYPQPAPHLDQMYHAYPQPQMYQNSMQQHQQPYPSTAAYTAPTTIPTLAPVPAPAVPASTAAPPAEALQQELQFSNHPRPNVVTTVGGANPLSATNLPTASGP